MSECMEKTEGEDNLTLIAKAQSGDRGAMERLISQNMGLVKNIARRFIGRNAEYEDLVQIGTIGMLKAAKSFDTSFGTVFSTTPCRSSSGKSGVFCATTASSR